MGRAPRLSQPGATWLDPTGGGAPGNNMVVVRKREEDIHPLRVRERAAFQATRRRKW